MITISRKNGCAVQYSESPLKLPNGEIVLFKIEGILQPHVEIVGYPNIGLFITPVKKGFNRGHSRASFFVKPEYLVVAPEEK